MDGLRGVLYLVGTALLNACAVPDDSYNFNDEPMEFRSDDDGGVLVPGGRPSGGTWVNNGLEDPDVSGIDPAFSLKSNDGLSGAALADADVLATAEYVVECALPANKSITKSVSGQTVELYGLLGLAPEWENGDCDEDCQEWVSACLLARTNAEGETVTIWMKGDHAALDWSAPVGAVLEAGFYGNLFAAPEAEYLCKGSSQAVVAARREGRTCSSSNSCDFTTYTNCTNHSRCTLDGPNGDVPTNCKSGSQATSAAYHTIATYVVP
jgi:hypothetical protein